MENETIQPEGHPALRRWTEAHTGYRQADGFARAGFSGGPRNRDKLTLLFDVVSTNVQAWLVLAKNVLDCPPWRRPLRVYKML
jgi:hypothetical protein